MTHLDLALPLYTASYPDLSLNLVASVDTETTRFDEPVYGWKGKTRIKPFGGHRLILGSVACAGHVSCYHKAELGLVVARLLRFHYHLVFHNAAFDVPVLIRAFPDLLGALLNAAEEGRIHDTKILEPLIQIAVGSRTMSQKQLVSSPSLKTLALNRAGMDLSKDPGLRLGFSAYEDPAVPIPRPFLEYAALDAVATYRVYKSQIREATVLATPASCAYPRYENCEQTFGLLTERIQLLGSLATAWLEQHPIRCDTELASRIRSNLESECTRFESALCSYKWAKRGPRTDRFSLRFKHLRSILSAHLATTGAPPKFSDTGLLTLEHAFWSDLIPRITKDTYEHPEEAQKTEDRLSVWLRYVRARKLLQTYIYPYASSPVHYPQYNNLGARTGRTSCARPNAQNIPKRRDGIRALIVPAPGRVLLEADFDFAELVALAQVYHNLYGNSLLEEHINSGNDPHIGTAKRIFGISDSGWQTLAPEERERHRQAAKAVNFGLPGGLGAKTFMQYARSTWGLRLTLPEAENLRHRTIQSDPQLARYLQDHASHESRIRLAARNLGLTVEEVVTAFDGWDPYHPGNVRADRVIQNMRRWANDDKDHEPYHPKLPTAFRKKFDLFRQTTCTLTGRIRDRASFTEARNTPFQGLVSDAIKLALWNLYVASITYPDTFWPVAYVHDSILVECEPASVDRTKEILTNGMQHAIRQVCPYIRGTCTVTAPLTRWGKNTNCWAEEIPVL